MQVVLVVIVEVLELHRFVNVPVFVAFGSVQPNADEHENARTARFHGSLSPGSLPRLGGGAALPSHFALVVK